MGPVAGASRKIRVGLPSTGRPHCVAPDPIGVGIWPPSTSIFALVRSSGSVPSRGEPVAHSGRLSARDDKVLGTAHSCRQMASAFLLRGGSTADLFYKVSALGSSHPRVETADLSNRVSQGCREAARVVWMVVVLSGFTPSWAAPVGYKQRIYDCHVTDSGRGACHGNRKRAVSRISEDGGRKRRAGQRVEGFGSTTLPYLPQGTIRDGWLCRYRSRGGGRRFRSRDRRRASSVPGSRQSSGR